MMLKQKNIPRRSMKGRLMALVPQHVKDVAKIALIALDILKAAWRYQPKEIGEMVEVEQIHRYILFAYLIGRNLGENIQTIATKHAISQIDKHATFVEVLRRRLIFYKNKPPAICVMQGWFEHGTLNFLPGPSVIPVWVGTHLQNITRADLGYLLRFRPNVFSDTEVGCRDKSTLEFCKEHGIPAYFSRCLTLTLPRRTTEPKSPRIFAISCQDWLLPLLPQHVKENGVFLDQRIARFVEPSRDEEKANKKLWGLYRRAKPSLYDEKAEELLARYRDEASLVITSALHCALPCVAMGIPTVFIAPKCEGWDPDRYSTMQGIIPVWTEEDLENGRVDFSPKAPDIEPLKTLLIENLDLSIRKAKGLPFDADRLTKIRTDIAAFQTPESQKSVASS